MGRKRRSLGAAAGLVLVAPAAAFAHSVAPGAGAFYSGLLHPVFDPVHILLLIALGLWLGRHEVKQIETPLACFAVLLIAGLALSPSDPLEGRQTLLLIASAGLLGALVASAVKLPRYGTGVASGVAALLLGLDSPMEAETPQVAAVALAGAFVGATLLLLYAVAITAALRGPVLWIGVRIVGSWIVASALLVLVLALKRQGV